jgi:hypothetical protein
MSLAMLFPYAIEIVGSILVLAILPSGHLPHNAFC